jgi:hypothetical protein
MSSGFKSKASNKPVLNMVYSLILKAVARRPFETSFNYHLPKWVDASSID